MVYGGLDKELCCVVNETQGFALELLENLEHHKGRKTQPLTDETLRACLQA